MSSDGSERVARRLVASAFAIALGATAAGGLLAWRSASHRLNHLENVYRASQASATAGKRADTAHSATLDDLERRLRNLETTTPTTTTTADTQHVASRIAELERLVGKPNLLGQSSQSAAESLETAKQNLEAEVFRLCQWATANGQS